MVREIVDLYWIGGFLIWECSSKRNGLETLDDLRADSLEESMLRIHPHDHGAFSTFPDRDWNGSPCALIDYRIQHGLAGE